MEEAIGLESVTHGVGKARQLDAVCAHDPDAAKLEAFGEVENGPALHQRREGGIRRQLGRVGCKDVLATQAAETLRPMMRSPASVCSR